MSDEMNFPIDEHSKVLRERWDEMKKESENAEKKERKVRGGNTAEYLSWTECVTLLNKISPDWEHDVISVESHYAGDNRAKGYAEAKVTLRILGIGRQDIGISEFGGANNQSEDNARKGAVRLALVRAANLFNIGLDTKSNNSGNQNNQNRNNNRSGSNYQNRNNNNSSPSHQPKPPANTPAQKTTAGTGHPTGQLNKPLNFEAPKLRAEIRKSLRELNFSEENDAVKKIFNEEIGVESLDKCADVAKLSALKTRIDKKKSGSSQSSVPPVEKSKSA